MRILDLQNLCWSPMALELIVNATKRFVRLDDSTAAMSKLCYARVAVEVNTEQPLVPGTILEFERMDLPPIWQQFEYEHIHLFCSFCGRIDHRSFEWKYAKSRSKSVDYVFLRFLTNLLL